MEEFRGLCLAQSKYVMYTSARGHRERATHIITLYKEVCMKQLAGMLALAIGVVLVLNGPAWSDQKGKGKKDEVKETVEMAAKAKVTIDQAIKTASEKVAGKVVEAELEKKHDKLVWEVEVVTARTR
jgi:uncharacterized membrane protein YkoI